MPHRIFARLVAVLLMLCPLLLLAQDLPVKTKLSEVSLFKNGLGFVSRSVDLPKGDATILMEGLPEAVHGTFWVYSADGAAIKSLVASERESSESVPVSGLSDLLDANQGKTVELRIGDKDIVRGKILSLPVKEETDSAYTPAQPSNLVLIQTDSGMVAVARQDIREITAPGDLNVMVDRKKKDVVLRLQSSNSSGKGHALVEYLTRGITWAPSCQIDITDPSTARILAKAEIVNELEDLDHVQVNFITGFPNLQFSNTIDPMALRGSLADFLNSLTNPETQYRSRMGMVQQQAVLSNSATFPSEEMTPGYSVAPSEGQTREDLFFYEQKDVSLKKGERGYFPLYVMNVPYEHIYEWKIGNSLDDQERYSYNQQQEEKPEVVWHSLRLTNTGSMPWTTAPAMIVQSGQVLGQDIQYYTSAGSKTMVKITQAVDIKAEQAEYEVDRLREAKKFYSNSYDLVTVRGVLKAVNYKNKAITLSVSKELSGEVLKSVPQAKVEQTAKGLRRVNPNNVLTWELPVEAQGKLEIEYQYKVYVRE